MGSPQEKRQSVCTRCTEPMLGKGLYCNTCRSKVHDEKQLARARRRYAKRKEAAVAASSQGGNRFER